MKLASVLQMTFSNKIRKQKKSTMMDFSKKKMPKITNYTVHILTFSTPLSENGLFSIERKLKTTYNIKPIDLNILACGNS